MLKRLFQASPSKASHASDHSYGDCNLPANLSQSQLSQPTQAVKSTNQQNLLHLPKPQDRRHISDWSAHAPASSPSVDSNGPINHTKVHRYADRHTHQVSSATPIVVSGKTLQIDQLKQQVEHQQQLRQVERKLSQTLNFSTIAGTTVVETAGLFNAKQVNLLRHDEVTQSCQQVVRYCQNQQLAWQPAFSITKTDFPTLLQQLHDGTMLRIHPWQLNVFYEAAVANGTHPQRNRENDLQKPPDHEVQQWLARWPGSWLLIPVRKSQHEQNIESLTAQENGAIHSEGSNFWGFMALALPERESWTDAAVCAAHSITVTLTAAMQHAHQYHELMVANQELQKLALSDGLTCLANRRRFDEHLADEWQRLAREKKPLSLILCDLDHFKRYNDTFGHPAGDRCLIRVARALLSGPQRPADLVARYGGEEFAIILPNTDTHGAWRIAQKIHESIRALRIDHAPDNETPYVTVTMGVSTVIPGHDNTAQMLVQASDLALYHAKQQGRNRTYVNGHYNTVSQEQVTDNPSEDNAQLDLMPLDTAE